MNILSWSVFIVCLLWGCGTIGFRLGEFVATRYYDEPIEVESPPDDEEFVKAYGQLLVRVLDVLIEFKMIRIDAVLSVTHTNTLLT